MALEEISIKNFNSMSVWKVGSPEADQYLERGSQPLAYLSLPLCSPSSVSHLHWIESKVPTPGGLQSHAGLGQPRGSQVQVGTGEHPEGLPWEARLPGARWASSGPRAQQKQLKNTSDDGLGTPTPAVGLEARPWGSHAAHVPAARPALQGPPEPTCLHSN